MLRLLDTRAQRRIIAFCFDDEVNEEKEKSY